VSLSDPTGSGAIASHFWANDALRTTGTFRLELLRATALAVLSRLLWPALPDSGNLATAPAMREDLPCPNCFVLRVARQCHRWGLSATQRPACAIRPVMPDAAF